MHSNSELIQLALGNGAEAGAAIDEIAIRRRNLARSFLADGPDEAALAARLDEVDAFARSGFSGDPAAEDYALAEAIIARWVQAPAAGALLAAMAFAPAHHFPTPPEFAQVPKWLRATFARYIVARPPIFLHVGEADRYAAHCERAMSGLRRAVVEDRLEDARDLAQAAAGMDCTMIYFNEQPLRRFYTDRATIIEWWLRQNNYDLEHSFSLQRKGPAKIGFLHRSLTPGTETFYLLAHLSEVLKSGAEVIIYLNGSADSPLSTLFEQYATRIVCLPADRRDAVNLIRQDDLDVCIISNNVTYGFTNEVILAAHRLARIQVTGAASPVTSGFSNADLYLSAVLNEPGEAAAARYEEGLARLPGMATYYAFDHDQEPSTTTYSRAALGASGDEVIFFSGANYFKITPEVLLAWAEVLARTPNSILVLMPFNPNWGSAYPFNLFARRIIHACVKAGVLPGRVKWIGKVPARTDLHQVMAHADIYLDSFPFSGACSLVDPLQLGIPVVARSGRTFRSSFASGMLRHAGLNEAICPDFESYVSRAVQLAASVRAGASVKGDAFASSSRTDEFAARISDFCGQVIAADRDHTARLLSTTPASLSRKLEERTDLARLHGSEAFRSLSDTMIVRRILAPWAAAEVANGTLEGRMIDVGACAGALSLPFLELGFRADLFEPDPDCAASMQVLVERFPGLATHHAYAVTGNDDAEVLFNKRSVGLSGMGESPFGEAAVILRIPATNLNAFVAGRGGAGVIKIDAEGADFDFALAIDFKRVKPRAIMLEFGAHFPQQQIDDVKRLIAAMKSRGYAAIVFEYRKLPGFGAGGWDHELVDVAADAVRLGTLGDAFGNIVFYPKSDRTLPAAVLKWLEDAGPAKERSAAKAFEVR